MNKPLVSLIITTKNEAKVIEDLLRSLKKQSYKNIEILVVDNNSLDKTKEISKKYTSLVFDKGPERSAQRNFGAKKAKGKYVVFLDADMMLTSSVIEACIEEFEQKKIGGIIIPEKSIGEGVWAKVKAFERSFYIGEENIEAARFYAKALFEKTGGFDEGITGPEDWELSERVKKAYGLGRISTFILHNEGNLSLKTVMRKKYYYGKKTAVYLHKTKRTGISPQTIYFLRSCFYRHGDRLITHPLLTLGMFWMLSMETLAGSCGFLQGKIHAKV